MRKQHKNKKSKKVKLLVTLIAAIGVTCFFTGIVLLYFANPILLNKLAAKQISKITGTNVTVGDAEIDWDSIILKNVRISVPASQQTNKSGNNLNTKTQTTRRLLQAHKIVLSMHPWSLIFYHPTPKNIHIESPTAYLTENLDTHKYNYQLINFPKSSTNKTKSLPSVTVDNAKIQFGQIKNGQYQSIAIMPIDGSLEPLGKKSNIYKFSLRQLTRFKNLKQPSTSSSDKLPINRTNTTSPSKVASPSFPTLKGTFNFHTDKITVALEHFRFAALQRFFMPQSWGKWWERLNPKGGLPTFNLSLAPDKSGNMQILYGKVFIHDASLTLPLNPIIQPRITNVTGAITIKGNNVYATNLRGQIAGLEYTLNGVSKGLSADAPFSITAQTDKFTIPQGSWYIFALPAKIQRKYHLLNPSGTFKVKVHLFRKNKGGPIDYSGQIRLLNARAKLKTLPYPMHNLKGLIIFNKNNIQVNQITGLGPSGAKILIKQGVIKSIRHNPIVDMTIEATNMPVDNYFLNALSPKYQRSIFKFTGNRIHKQNEKNIRYTPSIFRNITSHVYTDKSSKNHERIFITTTIDMTGFKGVLQSWKYPYTCASGQLIISPHKTTVQSLVVKGATGASATFDGIIDTGTYHNKFISDIQITNIKLPIDDLLIKSLPSEQGNILKSLDIHGLMVGHGKLFKQNGHTSYTTTLKFKKATANPYLTKDSQVKLTNISGTVQTSPDKVIFNNVSARYGKGTVTLKGYMSWSGKNTKYNLVSTAHNIILSQPIKNAFKLFSPDSSNIKYILNKYKPAGIFSAQLSYKGDGKTGSYTLNVSPKTLTINLNTNKVVLTNINGSIILTPQNLKFNSLRWNWTPPNSTKIKSQDNNKSIAWAKVSGTANLISGFTSDIHLSGYNKTVGPFEHAILPQSINNVLKNLNWQGGYKIENAHLIYNSATHNTKNLGNEFKLDAQIELKNDSLNIGASISHLNGLLKIHAIKKNDTNWPDFSLYLQNGHSKVWGRLVTQLSFRLNGYSKNKTVKLSLLKGNIYGGKLIAAGIFNQHKSGNYSLRLTVQHALLDGIIYPDKVDKISGLNGTANLTSSAHKDDFSKAHISSSLTLTGNWNHKEYRQGHGYIHAYGNNLYHQPFILAIVNDPSVALLHSQPFDDLTANFVIQGQHIRIEPIRMASKSLAIIGGGTLQLPSLNIDLNLVSRSSKDSTLGPLSQMINIFKDELITIEVTGTLNNPQIKNSSLAGFKDTWNQIFTVADN